MMRISVTNLAMQRAGYRERFAMKCGTKEVKKENGHTLWIFTYSPDVEYQDANGATYDVTEGR